MRIAAATLRSMFAYNRRTGDFIRRVRCGKHPAGTLAGWTDSNGYRVIRIKGKNYKAHQLAWLHVKGHWPRRGEVDHRDTNRSNNSFGNLRDATKAINMQNLRRAKRNNKTGFLGVSHYVTPGKFQASIRAFGKSYHLGVFDDPEPAHIAYLMVKREVHEGNTL